MDGGRAAWMCRCLKESRLGECPGTSGEEGTLPRAGRLVLRPCPGLHGVAETGTTRGAACSGPGQAQ